MFSDVFASVVNKWKYIRLKHLYIIVHLRMTATSLLHKQTGHSLNWFRCHPGIAYLLLCQFLLLFMLYLVI